MPATETFYDEFCSWPYFKPYGMVERPIQKPKRAKRRRASKKSAIALDLRTPKYKPRVIPNKKRANKRTKVTLGGDE